MAERKKEDDNNNKKKKTKQPVLGVGDVVRTAAHQYSVVKQLGQGGFGAVLEVVEQDPRRGQEPKRWAMKLEEIEIDKGAMANRLKIEVAVMKRIRDAPVEHKKHFTHMHDRCRTPDYRAIVMTLVGPSLADLLKRRRPDGFSVATALKLGLHTCEAIDDLHRLGFLHRDIKPANYATGADAHKIFLLDFGISKRYLDDRGHLRLPREAVHFLGTTRYAARTCHQSREQGRRDDLESWFYMLVEFFNPAAVFWRDTHDRNEEAEGAHRGAPPLLRQVSAAASRPHPRLHRHARLRGHARLPAHLPAAQVPDVARRRRREAAHLLAGAVLCRRPLLLPLTFPPLVILPH